MKYLKCEWIHTFSYEPILLYSEINYERNETRKIEIFKDGRAGYAFENVEFGGSGLSVGAIEEIDEINKDPQFKACEITADEFNAVWKKITSKS